MFHNQITVNGYQKWPIMNYLNGEHYSLEPSYCNIDSGFEALIEGMTDRVDNMFRNKEVIKFRKDLLEFCNKSDIQFIDDDVKKSIYDPSTDW
jgi:hypothetical protein